MAWESPIHLMPGQVAGADFSGTAGGTTHGYNSTGQFLFTKLTGDNTHAPCASTRDIPIGVSQTNPLNGDAISIMTDGETKIMVGVGGLNAGDEVGCDANGAGVRKGGTATGANLGEYIRGDCIEGAAQGALATIRLKGPFIV